MSEVKKEKIYSHETTTTTQMLWCRPYNNHVIAVEQAAINEALRQKEWEALCRSKSKKATPEAKEALRLKIKEARDYRNQAEEEMLRFLQDYPYPKDKPKAEAA